MTNPLGLYIHIPFCVCKCNYCDFYSVATRKNEDAFVNALINQLNQWGELSVRPIDTIYFGGGTPSLLSHRLPEIMKAIKSRFNVADNAEITMEMNPGDNSEKVLSNALKSGINRLSIGVQSGNEEELAVLGRRHSVKEAEKTVETARNLGFANISLDLMIGLPESTAETLKRSLEFVTDLKPTHISAYILKIEDGTPFAKANINLPDDDQTAQQYLQMCEYLESRGYGHYEISNFAKEDFESRHNLKYWSCDEYLGLGPSAHSFIDGKRFYFERNLEGFINGIPPIADGKGGDLEERIMLSLRLSRGLNLDSVNITEKLIKRIKLLENNGLIKKENNSIALTNNGMLLSNTIITEILECIV